MGFLKYNSAKTNLNNLALGGYPPLAIIILTKCVLLKEHPSISFDTIMINKVLKRFGKRNIKEFRLHQNMIRLIRELVS